MLETQKRRHLPTKEQPQAEQAVSSQRPREEAAEQPASALGSAWKEVCPNRAFKYDLESPDMTPLMSRRAKGHFGTKHTIKKFSG